jgi:hypothetical protein
MNVDISIVLSAIGGMVVFLLFQIVAFRFVHRDRVPLLVVYLLVLGAVVLGALDIFIFRGPEVLFCVSISVLLYLVVSAFYLYIIFSGFESSITLGLLNVIAENKNGCTEEELFSTFTISQIVTQRLNRFVATGEIQKDGAYFKRTAHTSVFGVREYIAYIIKVVFPPLVT